MNRSTSLLSALCMLLILQVAVAQHEGEESGGEAKTATKPLPPCARPLEDLYHSIEEIFDKNYTVYINCLSFNNTGSLNKGIASGTSPTGPSLRFVVECRGDILIANPSANVNPVDMTDIRNMNHTACVECVDDPSPMDTCVSPCPTNCERCYGNETMCSRCIACTSQESEACKYEAAPLECAERCPPATTIDHELYNHCECTGAKILLSYPEAPAEEEEIHCPEEEEEKPYRCEEACADSGHEVNNETGICFACGIAYCVLCNQERVCLRCLAETVLYEHECIACPLAPVAIVAIEQEHEVQEEEHEKEIRTIELAVILPVVSVLIIIFFVSMSIFAHIRYPHISYHGKKRHRRKPSHERSYSPNEGQNELQESHVWRARPTIVLR